VKRGRVRALAVVLAGLTAFAGAPGAQAEPDRQAKLNQLTKRAAALTKAYRGEIQSLEEAKRAVRRAEARAKSLKTRVAAAQRALTQFAQTSYMNGGVDPGELLAFGDGDLGQAATLSYLAAERAERLNRLKEMMAEAKKAEKAADEKVEELRKNIEELQRKRREVEKLLARFGFQKPDAGTGLTPRMINVRNQIMARFPMPYGVGCLRRGDSGEHGVGRACDFMMAPGGRYATGADLERGNALAEWCIKNGRRLGIMYIIWQQKYYDIRTGSGWRMMADRGSPTANHYDHVHVSVL
jgi:hypothetical protein